MGLITELKNVSKSFNEITALDNINLGINEGEIFALLGPSGSGKTTLLKIMALIEKPTSGEVYFGEKRVTDKNIQQLRMQATMVFQRTAVFNTTVYKNVAYGLKLRKISESMIKDEKLEVWHPEYGLTPHVFYKNLHRFNKCFIAGNVVLKNVDECAEGATVTLKNGSEKVIEKVVTNNYGDFLIDGLDEGSGQYRLEVEYDGYPAQELQVDLDVSTDVGTIFL